MNKHTATHEGFVFTRNSKGRIYSHCVVTKESRAADRVQTKRSVRSEWKMNCGFHEWRAKGLPSPGFNYTVTEADAEKSQARISAGLDAYVAAALERFDAENAGCDDTYYRVRGWAGRYDLAAKLASGKASAIILEAVLA